MKEQKGGGCSMISVRSTEFWHNSDPCVTKLIANTTSYTRGPSKKYTRSIDGNLNLYRIMKSQPLCSGFLYCATEAYSYLMIQTHIIL